MPSILAFDKISKRFGAVVVADAIDLALAEGEALGIIGPNGAGKTTLFGIVERHGARPTPGASCSPAATSPRLAPRAPLPHGHRPLVPDSAAVQRHDACSRTWSWRRRSAAAAASATPIARCVELLEHCGARRQGQPAGRQRSRCSTASGSNSRARWRRSRALLLLDEVAGGLTEHECAALVDADPKTSARAASRSSGSSMSCMRCSRWSTGWSCCTAARFIARGRSADRDRQPRGARNLHGDSGRCLSRSSTCARSTPSTATSRRCSASRCTVEPGEVVAVIGANGAGKIDAAQVHRRR